MKGRPPSRRTERTASAGKPFSSRSARLDAMNAALDRELARLAQLVGSTDSALLTEMVQHHLGLRGPRARRGKRVRANLALLTCEAFGHRFADALWAAVAVELAHNFSLVFDDIQDGDELRRGRPAVWKLWGAAQAINAGAALEALVPRAVAELMPPRHLDRLAPALRVMSDAMLQLCRGQVMDLQFEQRVEVGVEAYLDMIELKTASLFACATRLGALAAGAGEAASNRAADFGRHLGIAFQIIDDIQGMWGSSVETGKPEGSDLRNGKKTLPTLVAMQSGPVAGRRQLRALLTRARFTPSEMEAARTVLSQANAYATCRRQASEHLAEARLALFAMTERPNWAMRALGDMATTFEAGLA